MASALARAHILGEKRLRDLTVGAVTQIWRGLPAYDRANVDEWLSRTLPIVAAAQRQSVSLTEAYLARSLERQPLGVNPDELIGAAVRAGADPAEVYHRPFVTLWSKLGEGVAFAEASSAALARATGTAAMDVQLSMRGTLGAVQRADPAVFGYQRVADGGACDFCQEVDGAYLKSGDSMPLHNNCGCSVEALTGVHRGAVKLPDGTRIRDHQYGPLIATPTPSGVAVHEHGELGPVLGSPDHDFTSPSDI